MSNKRITIQDIANELGISRTTVSKVLNNTPHMPANTVKKVLNKAKELNYKQFFFNQENTDDIATLKGGTLALIAHILPERFHIATSIMASLEQELGNNGYSLTIHMLSADNINSCSLPLSFKPELLDGIFGVEIFDRQYSKMLCELGKPVLFFDSYFDRTLPPLSANILLMENRNSTFQMLNEIITRTKIVDVGFIGDYNHCISFHERYEGFCAALNSHNIPYDSHYCITEDDTLFQDVDFIERRLSKFERMPQLFFCANDLLAWKTISALKTMNLHVPKDILICGFDDTMILNSPISTLTTVATPSQAMGISAAKILLNQIQNPALPVTTTYLNSIVHIRESTSA